MNVHARSRGGAAFGGVVAGLIGGLVIQVILLLGATAAGRDPWGVLKFAGAPFLHERAMQPGFDGGAVLVGLICHYGVSVVWGVLFALLAYGLSKGATVLASAAWGVVVWFGMYYIVMPAAGLGRGGGNQPAAMAILEHVIFGLVVGIAFLPFQRTRLRGVLTQAT